jgi:hypothetical protein
MFPALMKRYETFHAMAITVEPNSGENPEEKPVKINS